MHVAQAVEADGVHLGFRSLAPSVAHEVLGEGYAIGFSAHEGDVRELWEDADYMTFGPVKDTPSKRGLVSPTGFDGLAAAVIEANRPVFGLGGLAVSDVAAVQATGAAGVCVMSGILRATDVASATRAYLHAFENCAGAWG
ncbi:MAG: thiamine-phosphate pyrophosphorylase [Planctomycetota bacterium]